MMMNIARLLAETTEAVAVTSDAVTADAPAAAGLGEMLSMLIPFALMIAVMYFILIRPQRKKDKEVKNMLANLKVGDKICTIGGLYGTIAGLKDDSVVLTMGSLQNTIVVARWAIRSVENVSLENDATPEI